MAAATPSLSLTIPTTTTAVSAVTPLPATPTVAASTIRLTLRGVHQFDVSAVALARHSTVVRSILALPSACDAARITSSSPSLSLSSPSSSTLEYALPASLAAPSWFVRSTLEYALRDERDAIAPGCVSYSCVSGDGTPSDVASNASTTSLRSLYDSSSSLASEVQSPSSPSSSSSAPSSPSSPVALSPLEVSPLTSPSSTPASSTRSVGDAPVITKAAAAAQATSSSSSAAVTPRRTIPLHPMTTRTTTTNTVTHPIADETDSRFDALLLSTTDPAAAKSDDVNDAVVLPLLHVAHALGLDAVLSELDTYMLEMYIAKVRSRVSRNRPAAASASASSDVAHDVPVEDREHLSLVLDFLVLAHSFDLVQLAKFIFDDVLEWWPAYQQTSEYAACESALKPHLLQPFSSLTSPTAAGAASGFTSPKAVPPTLSRTGTLRRGMRPNRSFHILPQGKPKVVLVLEQVCASRRLLTRKAAANGRRIRCGGSQM